MAVEERVNPDAVVVRCDLEEKPLLLEARPDILFETPHYHGYPAMLIRLDAPLDDVREFLFDSWLLVAPPKLARSHKEHQAVDVEPTRDL